MFFGYSADLVKSGSHLLNSNINLKNFSQCLGYLSPAILCIGVVRALFVYKKMDSLHKSISCYLFLMLGVDITSRIVPYIIGSNLIVLPVFSFIELLFFVYFYNRYLLSKPNIILIGLGIFGMMYIIYEFFQYFVFNTINIKQFQPYAKITDNFIVIIMALIFYYQKMHGFNEAWRTNFKLNTVLLLFFTVNAILFLPYNFLINASGNGKFYIWTINIVFILLFYIYLTVFIWKSGYNKSTEK